MRITKRDLQNMINRLNAINGFKEVKYNTVGGFRLYQDACGYAIHKIVNVGGGVSSVGNCYGMTTKECYYFLCGLLEG